MVPPRRVPPGGRRRGDCTGSRRHRGGYRTP